MCGVYYLTDGLDVIYVGASRNVEGRLWSHFIRGIDFSQVFVDECAPADLDRLEGEAITKYDPPANRQQNLRNPGSPRGNIKIHISRHQAGEGVGLRPLPRLRRGVKGLQNFVSKRVT